MVADDAPLLHCRSLPGDKERLACYDAILPDGVPSRPAARSADPASFGLPAAEAPAIDEIRSRVAGRFEGWEAKTVLQLENGQRWQIADGSHVFYQLDKPGVRIVRSALGGFLMDIDGVSQRPRVRRVK